MNEKLRTLSHKDLMVIAKIVKIMDIEHMSADPSPNGHPTRKPRHLSKVTRMIRITTQGIVVTIVKNMDTFLRIA